MFNNSYYNNGFVKFGSAQSQFQTEKDGEVGKTVNFRCYINYNYCVDKRILWYKFQREGYFNYFEKEVTQTWLNQAYR